MKFLKKPVVKYGIGIYLVLLLLSFVLTPYLSEDEEEPAPQQEVEAQEVDTLPANPYERISAIVSKHGEFAEIFDKNDNITKETAIPPYDVYVILELQGSESCPQVRDKAFGIIKSLYTDSIATRNIDRVKVMGNTYLTMSLGSEIANNITAAQWNSVDSFDFFKELLSVSDKEPPYDSTLPKKHMTFGVRQRNC